MVTTQPTKNVSIEKNKIICTCTAVVLHAVRKGTVRTIDIGQTP